MRLQAFLAKCGVASRRKSEDIIKESRVQVNGTTISRMGFIVNSSDIVKVDGRKIELEESKLYIMLNKPCGFVSTVKDQFARPTVVDLLKNVSERVYPVGRLDYDTSGLLLLTNDGDFTYMLTHPKHRIDKVYEAIIQGFPTQEDIACFEKGLKIENYTTSPSSLKIMSKNKTSTVVRVTIHEGKNRQVRKMFDAINCPVIALKRLSIGNLSLENLLEGQWRYLNTNEISSFHDI